MNGLTKVNLAMPFVLLVLFGVIGIASAQQAELDVAFVCSPSEADRHRIRLELTDVSDWREPITTIQVCVDLVAENEVGLSEWSRVLCADARLIAVPEPPTPWMLGAGGAAIACVAGRVRARGPKPKATARGSSARG